MNPVTFPNFPGLVSDLHKQNFHLVLITDLHIAHVANKGYMPYDTGHAGDHFVKNPDGGEFVGIVWPGPAVFPDFTRAQTREWWGNLYKEFVNAGVAGFWNDMNEPSVFNGPARPCRLNLFIASKSRDSQHARPRMPRFTTLWAWKTSAPPMKGC